MYRERVGETVEYEAGEEPGRRGTGGAAAVVVVVVVAVAVAVGGPAE